MLRDVNEANRMRMEGKKHIDLWVDGSIYPRDPLNGRYPAFTSVHDLIRFVGDGANGLLGYCLRLSHYQGEYTGDGEITLPSKNIIFQEYKASRWPSQKQCTNRTIQLVLQK